ncbi:alpha-amylase MalA [Haloarchaeobius amylolyticus]|uniref:alpha-amylase MalA n=1 Tax=Haloarchaeobius amylolyticus TaxID=1198296 RepID=UPI002270A13E|nr:alpha-amylase MalA [Haloarchaeobius amylolyticus]
MHHPGPPRFAEVGDSVELAPRDPDPSGSYTWRVADAPAAATIDVGDDAVEHVTPDVEGTYTFELDAPDGTHQLTVRVYHQSSVERTHVVEREDEPAHASGSGVFGSGEHATTSPEGREGRPRVRLDGAVDGDDLVFSATPKANPQSDADADSLDVEFFVDDRDRDALDGDLTVSGREASVPASAVDDRLRVHAVAIGATHSVADVVDVTRDDSGDLAIARPNDVPQWGKEMTLYEMYVRAFGGEDTQGDADAPPEVAEGPTYDSSSSQFEDEPDVAFRQGDGQVFQRLEERVPEIAEFGLDTIWLTPVLQHDGWAHGYNITDFTSIAEDLGTREDFESFVDTCHEHGVNVLFDLVLNHSAREHPYFQQAQDPADPYHDWYEWDEEGNPGTYFEWEYIANFDYTNLEVRRHLLDVVDQWAEVVDGFRCDMAWAVPRPFWQEIRDRVKSKDSDFLLLDETIPYLPELHELAFDVHFDTTLYHNLRQVGNRQAWGVNVVEAIEGRAETGFPDHANFMLYVENHDETRYVEECGRAATFAAAGALYTLPGIPMLYAGQEIGETWRREEVHWDDVDEALYNHYKTLLETREETPALGPEGDFERVGYESDSNAVVAYAREAEERYVVVLNFGDLPATVHLDEDVVPGDIVYDEAGGHPTTEVEVESVAVFPAAEGGHD